MYSFTLVLHFQRTSLHLLWEVGADRSLLFHPEAYCAVYT